MFKGSLKHFAPAFLVFVIQFSSCSKEQNWTHEVVSVSDTTYDGASITASYDIEGAKREVMAGISWSLETLPEVYENEWLEGALQTSGKLSFDLVNLYANTTYYVNSFIELKDGGFNYSPDIAFTTPGLPEAPCSVVSGEVTLNSTVENMTDLVQSTSPDGYYVLSCSGPTSTMDFFFSEEPRSAIYETEPGVTFLKERIVYIEGTFEGNPDCTFYGYSGQDIYVNNDGAGNISISFCAIGLNPISTCDASYIAGSGEVHN